MAALPGIPGLSQAARLVSAQARALAGLPRTFVDLNRSIVRLTDSLNSAADTLAAVAEVTARMERVGVELEEPLVSLRPGIERLARVLDDEVVDSIPDTLRSINDDVLPLLAGLRDTQNRVNTIASVVPGAALLFSRRPRPPGGNGDDPPTIEIVVEPED